MELKEYLRIIKKDMKVFLGVIIVTVLGTFAFFAVKPVTYPTSLALNITRSGSQQTADYKYDDFYRIQADDKFADTVVQWLEDPQTVADIYKAAGLDVSRFSIGQLSKIFSAEKLSSQFVSISFAARSKDSAKKISGAISGVLGRKTDALNKDQNENTWFEILAQDPVIVKYRVSPLILLAISLAAGIFLAFWVVMLRHYLK